MDNPRLKGSLKMALPRLHVNLINFKMLAREQGWDRASRRSVCPSMQVCRSQCKSCICRIWNVCQESASMSSFSRTQFPSQAAILFNLFSYIHNLRTRHYKPRDLDCSDHPPFGSYTNLARQRKVLAELLLRWKDRISVARRITWMNI